MPPAKGNSEEMFLVLGKLLSATETTAEGLRTASEELRAVQTAAENALRTGEALKEVVRELDHIIRTGNGDSLVMQLRLLADTCKRSAVADTAVEARITSIEQRLTPIEHDRALFTNGKLLLWGVLASIGTLVSLGLGIYSFYRHVVMGAPP
jgi:hypothetical protein